MRDDAMAFSQKDDKTRQSGSQQLKGAARGGQPLALDASQHLVILSAAKDLRPLEEARSFAAIRMTVRFD
jgi:hypothetical protein